MAAPPACIATQDWDPQDTTDQIPEGANPALSVQHGDLVWVLSVAHGYAFTCLFQDREIRGWVPTRVLHKGQDRRVPLPIEIPFRNQPLAGPSAQGAPVTVLQATLRGLWQGIRDNEQGIMDAMPALSDRVREILFHPNASQYGDAIFNGISAQARAIMDSGSFDPMALRNLAQVSPSFPGEPGLYLRLYRDFGNRSFGRRVYSTAVYVGQTVNFQTRAATHKSRAADATSRSNHYRVARRAQDIRMVPILLHRNVQFPQIYLDVAELSMICLFESWYPILFTPSNTNLMGAYGLDFDAAAVFSRIVRNVSQQTGWRPSATLGLNWNTPVIRNASSITKWLSWYEVAENMQIFRTKRIVVEQADGFKIDWRFDEAIHIPIEISRAASFQSGQFAHVIVEIRKTGNQYLTHPFRYVRLPPTIGRNPELEKLRALAIKIQWLEADGNWRERYLERTQMWGTLKAPSSHILQMYRKGLMVLSDVEQKSYSNPPPWLLPRSSDPVQFLRYNHLEQKLIVENVQTTVAPWPQDNTVAVNTARLNQMFPDDNTTIVGPRPERRWFGGNANRITCDICHSQRTTTACRYNERDETCQNCRLLNRPCTWSRGPSVMADYLYDQPLEELGVAINLTRTAGGSVHTMASPPFDADLESEDHSVTESN